MEAKDVKAEGRKSGDYSTSGEGRAWQNLFVVRAQQCLQLHENNAAKMNVLYVREGNFVR